MSTEEKQATVKQAFVFLVPLLREQYVKQTIKHEVRVHDVMSISDWKKVDKMGKENEGGSGSWLRISLRMLINAMIVFVLVEGFIYSFHFSYAVFTDVPYMSGQNNMVTVTIQQGESATDVADMLYNNRIIENKYIFLARVYLGKYQNRIEAGTYNVNSTMSPDTICKLFCGIQSEEAP